MNLQNLVNEIQRHFNAKEYDNAWQLIIANNEVNPTNADTAYLGVLILEGMGFLPQALARAQAWLTKEPKNAQLLRLTGGLLNRLGRYHEAIESLLRAQKIMFDPKVQESITQIRLRIKAATNHKPQPEAPIKNRRHQFFSDKSDIMGFSLWCIQTGLIVYFFIMPYWKGIQAHPTLFILERITKSIPTFNLSTHIWIVVALLLVTIIAGMFVQDYICKPRESESIVLFDGVRKIYSFHFQWLLFFMTTAASLYTNTNSFTMSHKGDISATLGIIAIAAGVYCLLLLVPGSRPRVLLIKTISNKGNRIVVLKGIIFQSVISYLPQQIVSSAAIKKSPMWIFSFTNNVEMELDSGDTLRLIAPGSIIETRLLPHLINEAMNDARIIGTHTYGGK